jgi:hypothetical protein
VDWHYLSQFMDL